MKLEAENKTEKRRDYENIAQADVPNLLLASIDLPVIEEILLPTAMNS